MTAYPTLSTASDGDESLQFRAFVQDEETRRAVDLLVGEMMIPHASVTIGGIKAAIDLLGRTRSPRVLVVDIAGVELPISAIDELAEVCEPGVTLLAIGERNDVGLFRELMVHGVADYLVKPITPALLRASMTAISTGGSHGPRQPRKLGRLVAFVGARGGVGTTMITANTACHIAHQRIRRVAAVDLDLQFGSLALALALDLEPSRGLREGIENFGRVDSLFLERALVRQSDTLHLLSGEEPLGELILPEVPAVELLLQELRGRFHTVLVDLPRQVSPLWQHVLDTVSSLVVVTDLSVGGMRDSARIMSLLPATNAACQILLVANRIGEHRQGELGRAEFEKGVGRPFDLLLPFDPHGIAAATNVGRPVPPKSKVAQGIGKLTDQLFGAPARTRSGLLRQWLVRSS